MHGAPSVRYPVRRPAAAFLAVLVGLVLLGVAGLVAVGMARADGWRLALMTFALVVTGGAAASGWRRLPQGALAFDGATGWSWQNMAGAVQPIGSPPTVALDLQWALMLRMAPSGGGPAWCWVERRHDPARWDDLRRAVYCAAGATEPDPPA